MLRFRHTASSKMPFFIALSESHTSATGVSGGELNSIFISRVGKLERLIRCARQACEVEFSILFHYKTVSYLPLRRHQSTTLRLDIPGTAKFRVF